MALDMGGIVHEFPWMLHYRAGRQSRRGARSPSEREHYRLLAAIHHDFPDLILQYLLADREHLYASYAAIC